LIVISGALVLIAAVLLILGIVSSITLVYAAIGLSIVSAVFLLVGVFQRPAPAGQSREGDGQPVGSSAPGPVSAPAEAAPVAAKPVQPPARAAAAKEPVVQDVPEQPDQLAAESADYPLEAANSENEAAALAAGAEVIVISGRPRYHLSDCEHVAGEAEAEPLDLAEARELGFTPCGTCRPNETLAHPATAPAAPAVAAKPVPSPTPAPEQAAAAAVAAAAQPPVTPEPPAAPAAGRSAAAPEPATVAASAVPAAGVAPTGNPADLNGQAVSADGAADGAAVGATDGVKEAAAAGAAAKSSSGERSGRAGRTVLAVAASKQYHRRVRAHRE
jgi:hypothetical protein